MGSDASRPSSVPGGRLFRYSARRMRHAVPALLAALLVQACSTATEDPPAGPAQADEQDIVYGDDDRYDVYAHPNPALRALAQNSIVALLKTSDITTNADGNVSLKSDRLGDREVFYKDYEGLKLCSTERFLNDPTAAFCSGTLIADDLVVTAGHCFDEDDACSKTSFVFGYYNDDVDKLHGIGSADVFACKEVIAQRYDRIIKGQDDSTPYQPNLDYAVVRIDRSAAPRFTPVKVRTKVAPLPDHQGLAVIGFGNGQPAKIDAGGKVMNPGRERLDYFDASLDASWGNSGSGVFDLATLDLVGVHVRGQGDNFEAKGDCAVVKVCPERGCEEGKVKSITYVHGAVNRFCDTEGSHALCAGRALPERVAFTFAPKKPLTGAPLAAKDGRVVVVGSDNQIRSLDASGKEQWAREVKLRYETAPVLRADGVVVVTLFGDTITAIGPDGKDLWSYKAEGGIRQGAVVGPDGRTYLLTSDGTLVALNEKGEGVWVFKGEWKYPGPVAIADDGRLAIAEGKVLYLLGQDGALIGKVDAPAAIEGKPLFGPEQSLVLIGNGGGLGRLDREGKPLWTIDVKGIRNPVLAGENVVVTSGDKLVAYKLADGTEAWSFTAKNTFRAPVAASADGSLVGGAMDGLVYGLGADGALRWQVRTEGGIEAAAAVGEAGIFVNSLDGRLYAIR